MSCEAEARDFWRARRSPGGSRATPCTATWTGERVTPRGGGVTDTSPTMLPCVAVDHAASGVPSNDSPRTTKSRLREAGAARGAREVAAASVPWARGGGGGGAFRSISEAMVVKPASLNNRARASAASRASEAAASVAASRSAERRAVYHSASSTASDIPMVAGGRGGVETRGRGGGSESGAAIDARQAAADASASRTSSLMPWDGSATSAVGTRAAPGGHKGL